MRVDLASFAGSLPRAPVARARSSATSRRPSKPVAAAATAAATSHRAIPRLQRAQRRRWRRWAAAILVVGLVAGAAYGAWAYVLPHSHPGPAGRRRERSTTATGQLGALGFHGSGREGRVLAHRDARAARLLAVDHPVGTLAQRRARRSTLVPSLGRRRLPSPTSPAHRWTTPPAPSGRQRLVARRRSPDLQLDRERRVMWSRQDHIPSARRHAAVSCSSWVSKGRAHRSHPRRRRKQRGPGPSGCSATRAASPSSRRAFSDQIGRGLVISVAPPGGDADRVRQRRHDHGPRRVPQDFPVPDVHGARP